MRRVVSYLPQHIQNHHSEEVTVPGHWRGYPTGRRWIPEFTYKKKIRR